MAHATAGDWATYIGTTEPAAISQLLANASLDIDGALIGSWYDATDADVLAALAEATCRQAAALAGSGAADGIPSPYQSVSAGSITLTRGSAAAGRGPLTGTELSPRAWQVLQNAGLIGHAVSTGYE